MRLRSALFLASVFVSGTLRAQATTTPDSTLAATIGWLTGRETAAPKTIDKPTAHLFDQPAAIDFSKLAGRLSATRVLCSLSYDHPPTTLAADISEKLGAINDLPAGALGPLTVTGDASRPNRTAETWARLRLNLTPVDRMGVCVAWGVDPDAEANAPPKLTIVLIKFQRQAGGEWQVAQIDMGQPVVSTK